FSLHDALPISSCPVRRISACPAVDHQFDPGDVAALGDMPGVAAESHWDLLVAPPPHFGDVASSISLGGAGALLPTIGVFIRPGKIAFTLTRLLAYSTAVVLVSWLSAAFDA